MKLRSFKYYLFVFLALYASIKSFAQVTITNKGTWIVNAKENIYINGSYTSTTDQNDSSGAIANGGTIYINGNITNNGKNHIFLTNDGTVVLNGSSQQTISGDSSAYFSKLTLNNSSTGLQLNQNIKVQDTLTIVKGNTNLNNYEIDLGETGYLKGESSANRIYGLGAIKALREISYPFDSTLAGLGMQISARTADFGYTTIERVHERQVNHTDSSINRYYLFAPVISTDSSVIDTLTVNYFPEEYINNEPLSNYKIFTSTDGGNSWNNKGGLVDTANNFIKTSVLSSPLNPVAAMVITVFSSESFNTCDSTNPHYIKAEFVLQSEKVQLGDTVGLTQLTEPTPTSYSWTFGDGGTSLLASPDYVYSNDTNTYLITMTVSNGYCSDTREKWITVGNKTINQDSTNNANAIQIYHNPLIVGLQPNPNFGIFTLDIQSDSSSGTIQVYNNLGVSILEDIFTGDDTTKSYDLSSLTPGMYLFKITSGSNVTTLRMVKG